MPAKRIMCSKIGLFLYTLVWLCLLAGTVLFFLIYSSKLCYEKEEPLVKVTNLWDNYRLPKDIKPIRYFLSIFPHFYTDTQAYVDGSVECTFRVERDTNYVIFHTKYSNISDVRVQELTVRDRVAKDVQLVRQFAFKRNDFYVLETSATLTQGRYYRLVVDYNARLDRGLVGFYKITYREAKNNAKRYIATTKFEPTDARKAFPCFDEPDMKATFVVEVKHLPDYQVLSNMPVEEARNLTDGYSVTKFAESVPMSTYLLAFIVGQFSHVSSMTTSGTPFRVYTTPDKIGQAQYALKLGTHMIDFYEKLFGIRYSLPKMDMIAIPDFVSGAMEHWGLVTFREIYLLYKEGETSIANRYRISAVISHEIVHQWFGNIVTMSWWDDIWLNEGFASYFEYKSLQGTENLPDMASRFLTSDMYVALAQDGLPSSHPIVIPVTNPKEIKESFDHISYKKGASLLRMLENVVGEENFVKGIQKYLQSYQYRNARTEELWSTLQEATESDLDITHIMNTWTRQMGYPVVTVTHVGGGKIKLTQERFLKTDHKYNASESPYSYLWDIPVNYTTSDGRSDMIWLRQKERTIDVGLDLSYYRNWIKLNSGQVGYYIVNYPKEWWSRFADILMENPDTWAVVDRLGLVHDAVQLADAGKLAYPLLLDLFQYLPSETNHFAWGVCFTGIKQISYRLRDTDTYAKWRTYVLSLVNEAYSRIEWDKTTLVPSEMCDHEFFCYLFERRIIPFCTDTAQLRSIILRAACYHDQHSCLDRTLTWLRGWAEDGKRIDPNSRDDVYTYGMRSTDDVRAIWGRMWGIYTNESNPQEQKKLLRGLARARDKRLIMRLCEYSLDPEKIKAQNIPVLLFLLGTNQYNKDAVWTWLEDNFQRVVKRLRTDNPRLWKIIPSIARGFTTEQGLAKAEKFFKKHPESALGNSAVRNMRTLIWASVNWLHSYEGLISTWLEKQFPDDIGRRYQRR